MLHGLARDGILAFDDMLVRITLLCWVGFFFALDILLTGHGIRRGLLGRPDDMVSRLAWILLTILGIFILLIPSLLRLLGQETDPFLSLYCSLWGFSVIWFGTIGILLKDTNAAREMPSQG